MLRCHGKEGHASAMFRSGRRAGRLRRHARRHLRRDPGAGSRDAPAHHGHRRPAGGPTRAGFHQCVRIEIQPPNSAGIPAPPPVIGACIHTHEGGLRLVFALRNGGAATEDRGGRSTGHPLSVRAPSLQHAGARHGVAVRNRGVPTKNAGEFAHACPKATDIRNFRHRAHAGAASGQAESLKSRGCSATGLECLCSAPHARYPNGITHQAEW